MSIQNVSSSTAAINSQLLQQQQQSGNSSFGSSNLPQLTSSQVQNLQQALQADLQQAFSSGGNPQTQVDSSVSNTLSQSGFSQNQIQSILNKINQGFGGAKKGGHGHGAHHARGAINSLIQTLQNSQASQTSSTGTSTTSSTSSALLTSAVTSSQSTTAGQSLDVTA
jgi:hypothetical protein